MTILSALNDYYDRLAAKDEVPSYGYSFENISFAIILSPDGEVRDVQDIRVISDGKSRPRRLAVPNDPRSTRTSGIAPYFLWDKTAYVFGATERDSNRTAREHAAFNELHHELLAGTDDIGLRALLLFLDSWTPEHYSRLQHADEMLDTNVIFCLETIRDQLHKRVAARTIWREFLEGSSPAVGMCLVTGAKAPLATLHPPIRGVYGAQMAGAYIVSFNINAFESYGAKSGANAPVSERAAFAYTTALNKLLERDSSNRIQIGDATTVFWAEAAAGNETSARAAEFLFATLVDPPAPDDAQEAAKIQIVLEKIEQGRPLKDVDQDLEDTPFYVLGLSPNAARLSVRFWYQGTLGDLAQRFREHWEALAIEPKPWRAAPSIWRLLYETAAQRKSENIPPLLAGELMRSILTGSRYPRILLSAVIMRMRADRVINGMRAAICKACLVRNGEEVPVNLNREDANPGYRLGRLFAVLENIQRAALGKINAGIRDRYYGAASATPASVFPILLRNTGHHLSTLRKNRKGGLANWFETEMGEIIGGLESHFPRSLRIEDQGRFAVGYYHERFTKRQDAPEDAAVNQDANDDGGE